MGARRVGLRAGSVLAGLVVLVGCNAIFGIEEGEPAPAEEDAGATSSGGASGTAQGGETSTGGSSGGNAGSGDSSSGGQGGASTGGMDTGGVGTGGATGGAGALAGSGAGAGGAGPGGAGSGGTGPGGAGGTLRYDFEGSGNLEGFEENFDCSTLALSQSTEQHFGASGTGSLKITITGPATDCDNLYVRRADPTLMPGQTITFSVYFSPSTAGTFAWLDFIVEDTDYMWTIRSVTMPATRPGWATTTYTIPSSIQGPIRGIGFDIGVEPGFDGSVYVDQFAW